jgi:cytochrome b
MKEDAPSLRVWDPFVRVFHWGLVAAFAAAWLTADEAEVSHLWIGYVVVALIGLRLVWGGIGPRHARFDSFLRAPTAVLRYVKDMLAGAPRRHLGHNPVGGFMIVAMLANLGVLGYTGWAITAGIGGHEAMEALHEGAATVMLALVGLHVTGVVAASLVHRENLPLSMITGRKRAPAAGDVD